MIKVYGMPTCPDCAYIHVQIKDRTGEFEYINIGEDVQSERICTAKRQRSSI